MDPNFISSPIPEGDFVPLAPIPGIETSGVTLVSYVNDVFFLIIAIAAMLAVLRLVTGGFKYMIEESVSAKGEARTVIQNAIIGLLLLVGSWVILSTINPQILDLSSLKFGDLKGNNTPTPSINQAPQEKIDALKNELVSENIYLGPGGNLRVPDERWGSRIDTSGLSKEQKAALQKACLATKGRRVDVGKNTLTCFTTRPATGG